MEKDKVILVLSLIIAILLFFYSLIAIFYPEKLKYWHEKSLKKSDNIFSKFAFEKSKKSKKSKNNISQRFTGFVALLMSIIMIYLFLSKLLFG